MPVDEDDPHSISWQGIGGDCRDSIPANAMEYIDDVSYLENDDFDELGLHRAIEPALQPDWHRPEEHFRGWIPTGPEEGGQSEWFQDLHTPIPVELTSGGRWQIAEDILQQMVLDVTSFRDALEALAEHPKYDTYVACPALFDLPSLHESYESVRDIQIVCTKAKRAVLEHWGVMAWWTASVTEWGVDVPEPIVAKVNGWNLLSRPKRGFLISIPRDWPEVNFGHLIRNQIPLFYLWGIVEGKDPRFRRLDPRLMTAYRDACEQRQVRSLWSDEILWMKNEFEECGNFDAFFHTKVSGSSSLGPKLRTDRLHGQDFDNWSRRPLADDENWELLDKLYHHVVAESEKTQTTTVVFLRFDRKPKGKILTENDDFMDDEVLEPCQTEIRERFKGRCAPKTGQGGWAAAMARPDHAGNYKRARPSRRQQHPSPPRSVSPPYLDAREIASASSHRNSRQGSSRRSASPDSRRGYPARERSPPSFKSRSGRPEYMQNLLARRADYLEDLREWSAQITHDVVLWRIPLEFGWNMQFLKEGYLIVSEAAEMRLRLIALMTPGVKFMRHILELGMERGVGFTIALPSSTCQRFRPNKPIEHRATTKARLDAQDRRLEPGASPTQTHGRWLRLLGEITALENARAIIARGGSPSWIVRAHGYLGLVQALMSGPSVHVTVYHGGGNDSADEDSMGLRWDEISENDYQCIYGYVAGATREKDAWMYPPDELLEELSKHYYREWNPEVDDLFKRIKAEWEDRPCRGKLRTRNQWREFFHSSNHGRFTPTIEVNAAWIEEAKSRFARAFDGSWNKKRIWEIAIPETFKHDF
ncbi:hypothetical protein B0H13DRAFT_1651614 [Mycena leptocephala]|nr:hypothetical protein B0H13DRAFT_1651614 [Mycena leptocephala]